MKPSLPIHIGLRTVAASMLVLSLASCSESQTPAPAEEQGTQDIQATQGESEVQETSAQPSLDPETSQATGSICNWEDARLIVNDANPPTAQQGDLAEVLIGTWQFTHYDLGLGGGWESWEDDNDRRYVYTDSANLVYCVIMSSGDTPSELGATYTLAGDQITLDNGNEVTAIAWTNDALLLSNNYDDSLELYHRR